MVHRWQLIQETGLAGSEHCLSQQAQGQLMGLAMPAPAPTAMPTLAPVAAPALAVPAPAQAAADLAPAVAAVPAQAVAPAPDCSLGILAVAGRQS